jgi:hypothetical protein
MPEPPYQMAGQTMKGCGREILTLTTEEIE